VSRPPQKGFGLWHEDLQRVATHFGVADAQVERDHAISHLLAAISESVRDDVIFFGDTALSRTFLASQRLSEDVDLIALGNRSETAKRLVGAINGRLIRSHGRPTWDPEFSDNDVEAAVLQVPGDISIRVQLLDARGYEPWPTEVHAIEQRYEDAGPAALRVPTVLSFAGWKTAAWHDRGAPRDLYDLWGLAEAGALNAEAAALFAKYEPINTAPREFMFRTAPSEASWVASLAGQTRLQVSAAEALATVRRGWAEAVGEIWD